MTERISVIVNTCANDPLAGSRSNPYRRSPYSHRADLLRTKILPAIISQEPDELLVVGQWEEGEGWRYIHLPPTTRDRSEALRQREMGLRLSTSPILIFSHDDHMLGEGFIQTVRERYAGDDRWDLLVPRRIHHLTGEELENGRKDGYMGGHVLVMRRRLCAQVPWDVCVSEYWDVPMTSLWKEHGEIWWVDDLVHLDVEVAAEET